MAAVDKIYGSNAQYDELVEWLTVNKPEALKYIYTRDGYTPESEVTEGMMGRTIANFPYKIDMWLLRYCPLDWVQKRLNEQYPLGE